MRSNPPLVLGLLIASAVARPASAVPNGYDLIFVDEFSGEVLDDLKWDYNYQWGSYHNHNAVMAQSQVSVTDGRLNINAVHGTPGWAKSNHNHGGRNYSIDYTSGAVQTASTFRLDEGYIEASMKMPNSAGSWPAFWMLNSGWPPEIDIMEYPLEAPADTNDERYYTNYFYGTQAQGPPSNGSYYNTGTDLGAGFNTFALKWVKDVSMEFYFNGTRVKSEFRQDVVDDFVNMYLIFNYAVGGWPSPPSNPSAFNDNFEVDWVRVWVPGDAKGTRFVDPQSNGYAEWQWNQSWTNGSPTQGSQTARFGTQGSATQTVEWNGLRNVGRMYFDGDTDFTLGSGNESLLLAQASNATAWSQIWLLDGNGSHTLNTRLDLWSSTSIRNTRAGSLTFNGDLISQARDGVDSDGVLEFRGPGTGQIIINGDFYQQRRTTLHESAQVVVNGGLFQSNNHFGDAKLEVLDSSTITLDGLNVKGLMGEGATDQSLGYLGAENTRLVIDGGAVVLRGRTSTERGFTIGNGGATIIAEAGADITFRQSSLSERGVASGLGGDLTLGGDGNGTFSKTLGGSGGLHKTGTGTWTLGSDNTYAGSTQVHKGTLTVQGRTGSGVTQVNAGAGLNGSGTITGDLIAAGGTIAPGDGVGLLTVEGNYLSSAGSSLALDLGESLGSNDGLLVWGVAAVGGSLDITFWGDEYLNFYDPITVLVAFGGLTGTFDTSTAPLLTETPEADAWAVTYTDNSVIIQRALFGDADLDGVIAQADLDAVLLNWGNTGASWATGDFNQDGQVAQGDLDAVLLNWGASAERSGQAAPVPEPTVLYALPLLPWLLRRRNV